MIITVRQVLEQGLILRDRSGRAPVKQQVITGPPAVPGGEACEFLELHYAEPGGQWVRVLIRTDASINVDEVQP